MVRFQKIQTWAAARVVKKGFLNGEQRKSKKRSYGRIEKKLKVQKFLRLGGEW